MVHIGKILKVKDRTRYIIEVEVPNLYESIVCYPLHFLNEPKEGDEVFMFELGSDLFTYIPIRTKEEDINWGHKGGKITIADSDDGDISQVTKGKFTIRSKGELIIGSNGKIKIHAKDTSKISIANNQTSLKKILLDILMMYMETKTVSGPLTPDSIQSATNNMREVIKLFE